MKGTLATSKDRLRAYVIVPVVVLLLASTLAYGTYFALAAVRPEVATLIPAGQVTFGLYVLIAIVEWSLAISIMRRLRRAGGSPMGPHRPRWPSVALQMAAHSVDVCGR